MKAQIANWKRTQLVELELDEKITVLFGHNRAGKSSILEAIAYAASGKEVSPHVKQTRIRYGAKEAKVKLTEGDATITLSLPGGQRDVNGWGHTVSAVAAGLVDVGRLTAAEFNLLLQTVLKTTPKEEDLAKALAPHDYTPAQVKVIWKEIQDSGKSGWDTVHEAKKAMGVKLKGQWREATKHPGTYGEKIAAAWYPQAWEQDLATASEESLKQQAAYEQNQLEAKIRENAVSDHEYAQLQETFLGLDTLRTELAAISAEVKANEEALQKAKAEYQAIPDLAAQKDPPTRECPYCEKQSFDIGGKLVKTENHKTIAPKELEANKLERTEAYTAVDLASSVLQISQMSEREIKAQIVKAEAAGVTLSHSVLAQGQNTEDAIEAQREALRLANSRLQAFTEWTRARTIYKSINRNQALIDLLDPKGLRKASLQTAVTGFNRRFLVPIHELSGWPLVEVHDDLSVTMESTSFEPSSGAEQFAISVTLQIAIAMADQSPLVIIDRADICFADMRQQFYSLLETVSESKLVLVGASANDRASSPDFAAIGLGRSYWVNEGAISAISKVEA